MVRLTLLLLFVLASTVLAQDVEPPVDATAEAGADGQAEQQDDNAGGEDEEATEDEADARFIPTEEISQDLGVSFPVDI